MKLKKSLLVVVLMLFVVFGVVACSDQSLLLNQLSRTSGSFGNTVSSYQSNDLDTEVIQLNYVDEGYALTLSDPSENLFIRFNQLRLELIDLHEEIITARDAISPTILSIKESVQTLRTLEYVLIDEDRETIQEDIQELQEYREGLLATAGEAYQRINDLRGTVTRDNLADVITILEEVKLVLEYRLVTLESAAVIFTEIDQLLLDYME